MDWAILFAAEARDSVLLNNVRTGPGAHSAIYQMGTGEYFTVIKVVGA
jgi:hypothetical protein